MIRKLPWGRVILAVWYLSLTFTTTFSLHYMQYHKGPGDYTYDLALETHDRAAIQFNDTAPLQYRILSYVIPELIRRLLDVSIPEAYSLFRWFWLWIGALVLHWYLRAWFDDQTAFIGNLLMLVSVPFMFLSDDLLPSDAPAFAFFTLSLVLLRLDRSQWLLLTVPIATTFRETSVFSLIAWAAVTPALRRPKKEVLRLLACAMLAAIVYFGIRVYLGPRYNPWREINPSLLENAFSLTSYFYLFFSGGVLWLLAFWALPNTRPFLRNLFVLIPVTVLSGWWYGVGWNGRYYWPLFPVLFPPAFFVFKAAVLSRLTTSSSKS